MDTGTMVVIGVLSLCVVVLVVLLLRRSGAGKSAEETRREIEQQAALQGMQQSFGLLQNQLHNLSQSLDQKLGEGNTRMFDSLKTQFGESQRLATDIRDLVHKQLTEVAQGVAETRESTKQVFTLAEQLQNLERVLKNQKQRGNLGEASLELVLGNILPPTAFKIQYEFPGGDTVDAIVETREGFIPVDAKFPLENYVRINEERDDNRRLEHIEAFRKDVKKRIDETSKYIRPKDGTLPFAFMFIPAEGIYYDLLNEGVGSINSRSLLDYAQNEKKVIIVSPTTFAAYLQSVLYGFKAFKVEKDAEQIKKNVDALMVHIQNYDVYYKKIGAALSTTVNHYNAGTKELGKIDKDVLRISGTSAEIDLTPIDRPLLEEKD